MTIRYNEDHTATILKIEGKFALVQLDTGDKFCVRKSCLNLCNSEKVL
jgi:hypothetical protein